MEKQTILNETHRGQGARMVPFAGWDMPLHYGSQLEEHHAVRQDAGMFDVSHMAIIDLVGADVRAFLRYLLANDVDKLKTPGKALYSCMLREHGGVIDDLIVYYLSEDWFRMVVNAGTAEKDLAWLVEHSAGRELDVRPRDKLAMIAVQGPNARDKAVPLLPESIRSAAKDMKPFNAVHGSDWFVGRTGYTGEDGFEVLLPEADAVSFWLGLTAADVRPCGLGARDTLRLEAGLNLYGNDMDESITPLESGLEWTLDMAGGRDFVGRAALETQRKTGGLRNFVGLLLEGRGVLRAGQKLYDGELELGELTSGGFSPTLERSIGLGRILPDPDAEITADIRGRRVPVRVVEPPFVRHGKARINL